MQGVTKPMAAAALHSRVQLLRAPHNFDLPGLRQGPPRYIIVLPLLTAVTLVCGTGAWMGLRKLGRDLRRIQRRRSVSPFSPRTWSQS